MTAAAPAPPRGNSARRLALLLVGGALLSKVLGLLREILLARAIGASLVADALRGGGTACLLPLVFLQNESVPAILIPAYREWERDRTAPQRFAALTVALTAAATAIAAAVLAFATWWIDLLLAGFGPEAHDLTLAFTRVMAFAMPASVLLSCLSGSEIALGRSRTTSIRATLTNVAIIAGIAIYLVTHDPVVLAWSFTAAFNVTALWSLWRGIREGALDFRGLHPRAVLQAFLFFLRRLRPLLLQPCGEHALIWIERLLASGLAVGTLASLDYARTLTDCAVLLVSQPIGLAVLSGGTSTDLAGQIDRLARPVLALAIPASISLAIFAPDVVELVFHRGAFDKQAIESTGAILRGIASGLWATTLGWIMIRMLNSLNRNRIATVVISTAYAANILTAALLVGGFGGAALGFGEAIRGVVLLTGVALALGCWRQVAAILQTLAPIALAVAAADILTRMHVHDLLLRLLIAGVVAAAAMAGSTLLLVPQARGMLASRFSPAAGRP